MVLLGYTYPSTHRLPTPSPPHPWERQGISFIRNDWIRKFSHGVKWRDERCARATSLKGVDREKMLRTAVISSPLLSVFPLDLKHFHNAYRIIISCARFNIRRHSLAHGSCKSLRLKKKKFKSLRRPSSNRLNKHCLGPWSNNPGNNIRHSVMTGIISALFINKVICEVLLTEGREWICWQAVMVYGRMVMIFWQQLSAKFRLPGAARRGFSERL